MLRAAGRQIAKRHKKAQRPHGRQSVKKLMAHGENVNSIEVEAPKLFDRMARRFHVDYAFYKTGPDKYLLFFKAGQADAITACFERYSRRLLEQSKSSRIPIREQLKKAAEQKRHKELDGLVKKLYEGNATGKIPDKHFTRLLNEYDEEQTGLETSIAEWQRQIESWNADKLKTDQFIQLVKRYTDFSELTTPMLNEFIEKVIVHEGNGRGNDRHQRIDIYLRKH